MDKKLKKKLMVARNRRFQIINLMEKQHRENADQFAEDEAARLASITKPTEKQEEEIWSARVQDIRNKLTGKKRQARERWNRFSGTSGGGGMGR